MTTKSASSSVPLGVDVNVSSSPTDRAGELVVEVIGDPALADLVGPVLGVQAEHLLAVAGGGEIEGHVVAGLHGAVDVGEDATAAQLGLTRLGDVVVGHRDRRELDTKAAVAGDGDGRTDLAGRVELDRAGLGAVGDLDFGRGDQVDRVLAHGLGEVLRNGVTQRLFTSGTDPDASFEHLARGLARAEARQVDLLRDELERPVDVVFELCFVDFDVQLDFVALEGLHRTLHRAPSVPVPPAIGTGPRGAWIATDSRVGPSNGQNGR